MNTILKKLFSLTLVTILTAMPLNAYHGGGGHGNYGHGGYHHGNYGHGGYGYDSGWGAAGLGLAAGITTGAIVGAAASSGSNQDEPTIVNNYYDNDSGE